VIIATYDMYNQWLTTDFLQKKSLTSTLFAHYNKLVASPLREQKNTPQNNYFKIKVNNTTQERTATQQSGARYIKQCFNQNIINKIRRNDSQSLAYRLHITMPLAC
jgi:hypothetical protein